MNINEEKVILVLIQSAINSLPEEHQQKINAVADKIRVIAVEADAETPGIGKLALSLVGAEVAAEEQ